MGEDTKALRSKLVKLCEELQAQQERTAALVAEMGTLLGGGVGMGERLKVARDAWGELWRARYRGDYVWTHTKDMPLLKKCILRLGDEELRARMGRYLQNGDRFYVEARHGFGLFVSQINRFAGESENRLALAEDVEAPADCHHTPACKSDQEHTRRRTQEMRA